MRQAVKGPCYLQQQDQIPSWELNLGCDTNWPSKHSLILIISWSFVCDYTHRAWQENNPSVCQISTILQKGIFLRVSCHTYSIRHVPKPTWVVCVQCRLVGECSVERTEDSPGQHAVFGGVSAGQMYHKILANIVKTMKFISMCVWQLYAQEGKSGKAYTKIFFFAHARVQTANLIYLFI